MSTMLESTTEKVLDTTNGDHNRFSHYFKKKDVDEALMTGKPARALCGKLDIPLRPTEGLTLCPECKEAHEKLPQGCRGALVGVA